MLCLKADAVLGRRTYSDDEEQHQQHNNNNNNNIDLYAPPSPLAAAALNFGNTIQRYLGKKNSNSKNGWKSRPSVSDAASSSSNSNGGTSSSGFDVMDQDTNTNELNKGKHTNSKMSVHKSRLDQHDAKADDGENGKGRSEQKCVQRSQLEQDIKTLQKQLEEEIDLHITLASAIDNSAMLFSDPLCQLPDNVQELLANIAVLEITVSKLEKELVALRFQLSQERNERRLAEYRLRQLAPPSPSTPSYSPISSEEQIARPSRENRKGMTLDDLLLQTDVMELTKESCLDNLKQQPNQLSEEMVRCMRNIFLCLADSSKFSSSGCMASPASPQGHLSHSSTASLSDSSTVPASKHSSSVELEHGVLSKENNFDPYRVQGKLNWTKYIGTYSIAAEVSWMAVGEKQLEYAAGALKKFRLLVEQLAKVNPAGMNTSERLAFWINLYNALIMHAYLAYGVPKNDVKFFSLMQKAAYTVGGHSFSAADIEYIILKMKPPTYRPQISLVLALHKCKLPEEQRKYAIENSEPLVAFALSCGMHSSPAVKIFRPENVMEDLQRSLKDYIQASVGISSKGKLLVPRLLHCYTKGVVEDSMLPDWICRFLSPEQAAMVKDCSSHHKQRLLSPRSFTVISFDSTFRYLFLPEDGSSQSMAK